MKEGNQIFIKVTSDYMGFWNNIKKYSEYINHMMANETKNQFYLEILEDGLMYIYNNLSIYKKINYQFSSRQMTILKIKRKESAEYKYIIPPEINSRSFPEDGINICFNFLTEPKDELLFIKELHLRSLFTDDVKFRTNGNHDLILTFLTFDAVLQYTYFLSAMFTGLLKELFPDNQQQISS